MYVSVFSRNDIRMYNVVFEKLFFFLYIAAEKRKTIIPLISREFSRVPFQFSYKLIGEADVFDLKTR